MNKPYSKLGIGTLSIPLTLFGVLFGFKIGDFCLGDNILNFFGLSSWSNGTNGIHYTVFYSLIFFVAAFLVAIKWKADYGAILGRKAALSLLGVLLIMMFFLVQ